MADLSMEQLLPRANYSIYKLVRMASSRALELSEGSRCLAENSHSEKFTTMALEEIAQGKIELKETVGKQAGEEEKKEASQKAN